MYYYFISLAHFVVFCFFAILLLLLFIVVHPVHGCEMRIAGHVLLFVWLISHFSPLVCFQYKFSKFHFCSFCILLRMLCR